MTVRYAIGFLVAMFIAALLGLFLLDPISQDPAYHRFADTGPWLGIPNFGDVMSNLPFAVAGGFGLWRVIGSSGRRIFDQPSHRWPYVLFFAGVALVSVGSAYYHLAPDNERLVWDRLPMTIAFMAMSSMFIADRIDQRVGVRWSLPILILTGMASVYYWHWTETSGRGDLRFYFLVQFYPVIALPVICWLFPVGRYTSGRYLAWLIMWYILATALERFDHQLFDMLGETVSGHSLKHLAASISVIVIIRMLGVSLRHQTHGSQHKGGGRGEEL